MQMVSTSASSPGIPKNDRLHSDSDRTPSSRRLRCCCVGFTPPRKARSVTSIKLYTFQIFIPVTTDAWTEQVINSHNQNRARYGAGPVSWNSGLFSSTLSYANGCKFAHRYEQVFSCMKLYAYYFISNGQGRYGENLVRLFAVFGKLQWLIIK
jgi:hypothetical protein